MHVNPFPHTTIMQQTTLKTYGQDYVISFILMESLIIKRSRTNCGERRNCSFGAISSFVTMFSKVVCCRCQKASVCWKGLKMTMMAHYFIPFMSVCSRYSSLAHNLCRVWLLSSIGDPSSSNPFLRVSIQSTIKKKSTIISLIHLIWKH